MRSAQRQVELRPLGNQLPVLGKANSLRKIVKFGVFCLFVKLRLSPGCVGPGRRREQDIPDYPSSDKISVSSRDDVLQYQFRPWRLGKILTTACYAFSYALSRFVVP